MKLEVNTHELMVKYQQQGFEKKKRQNKKKEITDKVIRDLKGLIT